MIAENGALGSNVLFGGQSAAPIRHEIVYDKAALNLDGEVVIKDGNFVRI